MFITIQYQAAPLLCSTSPTACLSPSFFLSVHPSSSVLEILFLPRLLLIVAAFSVEHAAEIMNDVSGPLAV